MALSGCGGDGSALIGIPGLNIAGAWVGSAGDSTRQMTMTLQLAQRDRDVTGTFSATTPTGAPIYSVGRIEGTVSATTFSFRITVPPGSIEDNPDCTATFIGTADDIQTDSMAGTYTGSDTCGGTFAGGRFTLLRQ
jgi:hypothetical protein